MNGKQAKLLKKYAQTMKYDAEYLIKEFKSLDRVTRGRMTGRIKHALANVNKARAKVVQPA